MSEVADRYSTIADGFTARLAGVPPDGWSAPSPCSDWKAGDIVAHVVNVHRRVLSTLDGSEPPSVTTSDDLSDAWRAAKAAIADALLDDVRAATVISGMFGEQPFESLVSRLLCADTLVHTWDLARATGQDEHLDSVAVTKAMEFLAALDDAIRRPGGFAAKIEPAAGADEQTRLLNFCGRPV